MLDYNTCERFPKKTNQNIKETNKKNKKGIKIMCSTLDRLADKKPDELLSEAGLDGCDSFIDLEKLLKHWNVSAKPVNFSKLKSFNSEGFRQLIDSKGAILGAAVVNGDNLCIFYNEDDSPNRQRFTIAHELAHFCNDYDILAREGINCRFEEFSKTDEHEKEINAIAGAILIPEGMLRNFYKRLLAPSAAKLAMIFGVSDAVMNARLEHLKIQI